MNWVPMVSKPTRPGIMNRLDHPPETKTNGRPTLPSALIVRTAWYFESTSIRNCTEPLSHGRPVAVSWTGENVPLGVERVCEPVTEYSGSELAASESV